MYNDYYLLKKIEDKEGEISYATAMDSFIYKGEVVEAPHDSTLNSIPGTYSSLIEKLRPAIGDQVIFLRGSGEDLGDGLKAVKFEDIIKKI